MTRAYGAQPANQLPLSDHDSSLELTDALQSSESPGEELLEEFSAALSVRPADSPSSVIDFDPVNVHVPSVSSIPERVNVTDSLDMSPV